MPDHNFLAALVGSFATPAAENPTVAMIEAAFHHHGMNARYINCEVEPENLGAAARGARAMAARARARAPPPGAAMRRARRSRL